MRNIEKIAQGSGLDELNYPSENSGFENFSVVLKRRFSK